MSPSKEIHPDFLFHLEFKNQELITLFKDLRTYVLSLYPDSNELLYHTHALTTAFSISEKLGDCFCMIPIYSKHLNLGFNKGVLLDDPYQLLKGTGKLMRHIPRSEAHTYELQSLTNIVFRHTLEKKKSNDKRL